MLRALELESNPCAYPVSSGS